MIVINEQKEMKKYYCRNANTYIFKDDVMFKCDIDVESNIKAYNIYAYKIKAYDIYALGIHAHIIYAHNIETFDIETFDIDTHDIDAYNIKTNNIKAVEVKTNKISACNKNIKNIIYKNGDIMKNKKMMIKFIYFEMLINIILLAHNTKALILYLPFVILTIHYLQKIYIK